MVIVFIILSLHIVFLWNITGFRIRGMRFTWNILFPSMENWKCINIRCAGFWKSCPFSGPFQINISISFNIKNLVAVPKTRQHRYLILMYEKQYCLCYFLCYSFLQMTIVNVFVCVHYEVNKILRAIERLEWLPLELISFLEEHKGYQTVNDSKIKETSSHQNHKKCMCLC